MSPNTTAEAVPQPHESSEPGQQAIVINPEDVSLVSLRSLGYKLSEIAQALGVNIEDARTMCGQLSEQLQIEKIHGAVYIFCEAGLIDISDEEAKLAASNAQKLPRRPKEALQALMLGLSAESVGGQLGLVKSTANTYLQTAYSTLGAHSAEQAVRLGYAAGIRPEDSEHQLGQESPVSKDNLLDFLGWMYDHPPIVDPAELSDAEFTSIANSLLGFTLSNSGELGLSNQKMLKKVSSRIQGWFEGQTIASLARTEGSNDGSVAIGLSSFAGKLGRIINKDKLIDDARQQAAESAAGTVARTIQVVVRPAGESTVNRVSLKAAETPAGIAVKSVIKLSDIDREDSLKQQVLQAVRDELLEDRLDVLNSSYQRQFKMPQNFEAEVVTHLNIKGEPEHIDDIIHTILGHQVNARGHAQIEAAIAEIVSRGFIADSGDGYYATYVYGLDEPVATTVPGNQSLSSSSSDGTYSRQSTSELDYFQDSKSSSPSDEATILDGMLEDAGIQDKIGYWGKRRQRQ